MGYGLEEFERVRRSRQREIDFNDRAQAWILAGKCPEADLAAVLEAVGYRRGPVGYATILDHNGFTVYVAPNEGHAFFWLEERGLLSAGLALVAARAAIVGDEGPAWGGAA